MNRGEHAKLWGGGVSCGDDWTLKRVAEVVSVKHIEHEVATIERIEEVSPATVGSTMSARANQSWLAYRT